MRVWSFIFTNPQSAIASARVAAVTCREACAFLNSTMHTDVSPLSSGVISDCMGSDDDDKPGVRQVRLRESDV